MYGDKQILEHKINTPEITVYCARSISGCKNQDVVEYYKRIGVLLSDMNINVLIPIYGRKHLGAHALRNRCKWMVRQSDVIFINLVGATRISIGSIMELAWADAFDIHSVIVLDKNNIHDNDFMLDAVDVVFTEEKGALAYLNKLANGVIC